MRTRRFVTVTLLLLLFGLLLAGVGQAWDEGTQFAFTPKRVEVGGQIEVWSVTPCPAATSVVQVGLAQRRSDYDDFVMERRELQGGGHWALTLVVPETAAKGRTSISATCFETLEWQGEEYLEPVVQYPSQNLTLQGRKGAR